MKWSEIKWEKTYISLTWIEHSLHSHSDSGFIRMHAECEEWLLCSMFLAGPHLSFTWQCEEWIGNENAWSNTNGQQQFSEICKYFRCWFLSNFDEQNDCVHCELSNRYIFFDRHWAKVKKYVSLLCLFCTQQEMLWQCKQNFHSICCEALFSTKFKSI